jgi:hypothetical protein
VFWGEHPVTRFVLTVLVCIFGSVPVLAQSSLLDFSKPMTGKSRFGINPDGSSLELGAPAQLEPDRVQEAGAGAALVRPCDGGSCRFGGISAGAGAGRAKTVQVNGYTRKDGTFVAPYVRSAPRRR